MSKRQKNILLCLGALLLGAVLYILFRQNTWVARLFSVITLVPQCQHPLKGFVVDWARYYVPDLLWAFSLSCGIQAIYVPSWKGTLIAGTASFGCGITWEVLQWTHAVSGTGDLWDILMYLTGSVLSILINIKGEKQT